jgi:feruloyl esterase
MVAALEQWVEKGVAPTHIVATKFISDDKAKGVALTRPLCPFPQIAKYQGSGDLASAKNFSCANPN